jgi:hypothetical protein
MYRKSVATQVLFGLMLLALFMALSLPRYVVADSGELSHQSRYPDGVVEDEEFLAENPELIVVARYEAMAAQERDPLAANPELRFVTAGDEERDPLAVNPELKYLPGSSAPVAAQH